MKNDAITATNKVNLQLQDATELRKRALEDAFEDADSYAIRVRREFENNRTASNQNPLASSLGRQNSRDSAGSLEEIDGVLIHSVEGTTKLVLSDELLEISNSSEAESVAIDPMNLFHVQSRSPWVQRVRPGMA